MQLRTLGKTGYDVFPVVYGGVISMKDGQRASDRYVAWAVERGVNYFDVAPSYGDAEEKLGASLKPYRKNVYLACKTMERLRGNAEKELARSMELLNTDYFDVYQMHAVTTPQDVDLAFGAGGVMELLRDLKDRGVVRKVGITAHSETAALRCLLLYPFDTVMFPTNWMLHIGQEMASRLKTAKEEQGFGYLGIKSLVERAWREGDDRTGCYPKSWCKPFDADSEALRIAAMKYALQRLGPDALVPPGNFECLSFMVEHIEECINTPLVVQEAALLRDYYEKVKDFPFFQKNNGDWAE